MSGSYYTRRHTIIFTEVWDKYGEDIVEDLPGHDIIILDPSGKGKFPARFEQFSTLPALSQFVSQLRPTDKVEMYADSNMRKKYAEMYAEVPAALNEAKQTSQIVHNTLVKRFIIIVKATLENLPVLSEVPWFADLGRTFLEDVPVFIVSAGPSLDSNGHLLKECAKKGIIMSVNSSAAAVAYHGAESDMMVSLEALDLSDQLAKIKGVKSMALCLSGNKKHFGIDCPKVTFASSHPAFINTLARLGINDILPYGSSVATAAVVMARFLGAKKIILLGQDLSYTNDQVYAKGTGKEATVSYKDGLVLRSDTEAQTKRYEEMGLDLAEVARPYVEVEGLDGEMVRTTQDMLAFLRWFESFPGSNPDCEYINCTAEGLKIEGWEPKDLSSVLKELPDVELDIVSEIAKLGTVDEVKLQTLWGTLWTRATNCYEDAKRASVMHPKKSARALQDLQHEIGKVPLVEQFSAPEIALLADDSGLGNHNRVKLILKAVMRGTKHCLETMAGAK